jgi:hypothetical protein
MTAVDSMFPPRCILRQTINTLPFHEARLHHRALSELRPLWISGTMDILRTMDIFRTMDIQATMDILHTMDIQATMDILHTMDIWSFFFERFSFLLITFQT